jgi:hypothetical protein
MEDYRGSVVVALLLGEHLRKSGLLVCLIETTELDKSVSRVCTGSCLPGLLTRAS